MMITVELTMYPLQDNYRELIKDFIARLRSEAGLKVTTGPTLSVIIGEYDRVMDSLKELIEWSHTEHGRAVFIAKFLPGYNPE